MSYVRTTGSTRQCFTGAYVGDGAAARAIPTPFTPKAVIIFGCNGSADIWCRLDTFTALWASNLPNGAWSNDRLLSLNVDGFTVSDAGADAHPNKNLEPYQFIVWGE